MQFVPGQHIHCIGIGGFGISAIARILLLRGFSVSGSDRNANALTEALSHDGATVYKGHSANHIDGADLVIATSAVGDDHIEVVAAKQHGIPVYRRRDILASLMEGQTVIAVAGTHGKTTTTSMIVHILRECGRDPSYIVGGIMASTGANAGVGQDDIFVIEADEYDNMFLGLKPNVTVLTGIEYDHPDFFKTEDQMVQAFSRFWDLSSPSTKSLRWRTVVCVDSKLGWWVAQQKLKHRTHSEDYDLCLYGIDNLADAVFRGSNLAVDEDGNTVFEFATGRSGRHKVKMTLPLPGKHNVLNAMAAMLAVDDGTLPADAIVDSLKTFRSTSRRFEVRGEVDGVIVIDDYAHHPTAIRFTLEAARQHYPDHALWAVWQPHMYTRTQQLMDDYAMAFGAADHVVVMDIYGAREEPIPGVDGAWVTGRIGHVDVHHTAGLDDAVDLLVTMTEAPAVIVIMSAGDAPKIGVDYLEARQNSTD